MNNEELKKKIIEIINNAWAAPVPCTAERKFERIADALIAAGIGDVSEWKAYAKVHRIVITKDDKIKQLYSDEEVDKIVNERAEYKHRAEVAERALLYACKSILKDRNDTERRVRAYFNAYLERAEKEIAEEGKDEQN